MNPPATTHHVKGDAAQRGEDGLRREHATLDAVSYQMDDMVKRRQLRMRIDWLSLGVWFPAMLFGFWAVTVTAYLAALGLSCLVTAVAGWWGGTS